MANSYTKAAFYLTVTSHEAEMLRLAERAVDILDTNGSNEDLAAEYDALPPAFHKVFPPTGASKFESFLALFDDWHFPFLDARIDLTEPDEKGSVSAYFSGEQFGVEQIARLIQVACPSALPCGFTWSTDCDRLRAGEFGGGSVIITASDIDYRSTQAVLERALHRAGAGPEEGVDGLVLAVREPNTGEVAFWNEDRDALGPLATATVYHPSRAATWETIPFADFDWMALPAPFHG